MGVGAIILAPQKTCQFLLHAAGMRLVNDPENCADWLALRGGDAAKTQLFGLSKRFQVEQIEFVKSLIIFHRLIIE